MSKIDQAVVLVSGGMDSVAALCWARRTYADVWAVLIDYGQPNRDQEMAAAWRSCEALGVEGLRICISDSLPRGRGAGILHEVRDDDGRTDGTSPAFIPARNLLFATSAAAHAAVHWPNGSYALVLGCNAQDAKRFPDCHPTGLRGMGEVLRVCTAREVQVVAPWVDRTKAQIVQYTHADDLPLVARSWSCYRGSGPCGRCSPCVLRAEAFAAAGVADCCHPVRLHGGDPGRG